MLDKPRKGVARNTARKILKDYKIKKYPVELMGILEDKNYKYIEINSWKNNVDALLIPEDGELYLAVNGKHHDHRKRFSLAHELGHIFLNHDLNYYKRKITFEDIPITVIKEHIAVQKHLETEANIFAGELLVPLNWLKKEFEKISNKNNIQSISFELAKIFNVSSYVMSIRITDNLRSLY